MVWYASVEAEPEVIDLPGIDDVSKTEMPWLVIVWNDPINLMTYVTFVFQKLFGYSKAKAERLMLDVHLKGRAVLVAVAGWGVSIAAFGAIPIFWLALICLALAGEFSVVSLLCHPCRSTPRRSAAVRQRTMPPCGTGRHRCVRVH